jgi:Raf kinase inhibitor-like YbhB/YbcL family protein
MEFSSPDFADGDAVPKRFTCEGDDVSPGLEWGEVPSGTANFALTCEDPDAPGGTFVHWVAWGIDPAPGALPSGAAPPGQGRNDFGGLGYGGPCPPPGHGAHRYIFTLYALTEPVSLPEGISISELRSAIEGKLAAEATLTGTYER